MRTKTFLQRIALGLFTILSPLVFFVAGARSVTAQTCPSPTVQIAPGKCVLTHDVTLTKTLTLPPNTTLNCQSHKLSPPKALSEGPRPGVAIFLGGRPSVDGARNIQIKNCVIDGFDFGIFAIDSKRINPSSSPHIQILQNRINARFVALSLMSVDDSEIRGNDLTTMTKGGRALYVGRDSDRNRILHNRFTTANSVNFADEAFRVPGPKTASSGANPPVSVGSAVVITQTEGAEPMLLNAIIEGRLFQLTVANSAVPDQRFSEGNTFTGNTVTISGAEPVDGVVLAVTQGTLVSNNNVVGAKNSIRVGIQTSVGKRFPGKCQLKPNRLCLDDNDCQIPRFDPPTPSPDTCTNLPQPTTISWVSVGNIIENNIIRGPFDGGIGTLGEHTRITGNTIIGPLRSPVVFPLTGPPVGGIVLVGKFALGTTIVTRNTVRGVAIPLTLAHAVTVGPAQSEALASQFRAYISLNDFTGYSTAVLLLKGNADPLFYDFSSQLGGNFWGPLCFDPTKVLHSDGSPQPQGPPPLVNDSSPFSRPVARSSPLPLLCN